MLKDNIVMRLVTFLICSSIFQLIFNKREQDLMNSIHKKDFVRAVCVALSLDQPFRVLQLLKGTKPFVIRTQY